MDFSPSKRDRTRAAPRLQFTSMIDVIFLLLIFFMTTTTLAVPESQLASGLRSEDPGGETADLEPQILEATMRQGREVFALGDRVVADKSALTAMLRQLPREAGVFVRVDDSVSVAHAAAALQAVRDAGFEKVSYVPRE